ncbi:hypothetical protein [Deinococcus navajonensis]|uniref:Uncharacterized protein n=1 Tax=Deinococcus navajonensis TaxID=309884 RepID=A0ABV8XPD4_9DEIO
MAQDLLNALALPMLFSMMAGAYGYFRFPERRPALLLNLLLILLVGAYSHWRQPSQDLFNLLLMHSTAVFFMLLHHLQTPVKATERVNRS